MAPSRGYQVTKEGYFLAGAGTSEYLGGTREERNSSKSLDTAGKVDGKFCTLFPSLERLLKVQSQISYI